MHPDYKMPTSAGSWAMMKTFPADDALLVKKVCHTISSQKPIKLPPCLI